MPAVVVKWGGAVVGRGEKEKVEVTGQVHDPEVLDRVKANDQEAISAMFEVLRIDNPAQARVARIRNTLDLEHVQLSQALARDTSHPDLSQEGDFTKMAFDSDGALQ